MDGFGERLRARARELGLSDAEVARRAGLTQRRYGHYVRNTREPDLATLVRIAGVLGTTPNRLLLPADQAQADPAAENRVERAQILLATLDARTVDAVIVLLEKCVFGLTAADPDPDIGTT
ncbi:MAG: helix-turn-helix transcriptional regulator [Azospirillaceae bacterium]